MRIQRQQSSSIVIRRIMRLILLLLSLSVICIVNNSDSPRYSVAVVWALPAGFVDEGITAFTSPITALFLPNRRNGGKPMMMLVSKEGVFQIIENPDTMPNVKIDAGNMTSLLCSNGSRGVFNVVAHHNFLTSPYIFVYYSKFAPNCPADPITGPSNVVSRFAVNPNTLQILFTTSEKQLIETNPFATLHHHGGAMTIGTGDTMLYVAFGDDGNSARVQDLTYFNGKLLRIDVNGNVPATNPFTLASGGKGVNCRSNKGRPPVGSPPDAVCEEIYSYGFRNPFRSGVDPNVVKTQFTIADVGNNRWDELSYAGADYKGKNYGWPMYEGPCAFDSFTNCPIQMPVATHVEPYYYYSYIPAGAAVTGVAHVPTSINWPTQYKLFMAEYVESTILNLIQDNTVGCRTCTPHPRPSFRNETFHTWERLVGLFFGPYQTTQALYYISRKQVGMNVRRIRYVGGTNGAPIAVITLPKKVYAMNEVINFSGIGSSDPDGHPITYLWNFGDGRTSTDPNPTLSYSTIGTKNIQLQVTDSLGSSNTALDTISVGTPPTVVIDSPANNYTYAVGDIVRLIGRGRDVNNRIPLTPAQLTWEVLIRHAGHTHPFVTPRTGNNFTMFPTPGPEDFQAATNSFLQFILTGTDSNGLSFTTRKNIYPRKILIDIECNMPTCSIKVGDFTVVTPMTITTWFNQTIRLEAPLVQNTKTFQSWNNGGTRIKNVIVRPTGTARPKIIANYA